MWYVLLSAATAGALIRGSFLQGTVERLLDENAILREKLAKFDRAKGAHGYFVSQKKKTPIEQFMDREGRDAGAGTNLLH